MLVWVGNNSCHTTRQLSHVTLECLKLQRTLYMALTVYWDVTFFKKLKIEFQYRF